MRAELLELLAVLTGRSVHLHTALTEQPAVPLQTRARHTRSASLAASDVGGGANAQFWR